MIKFSQSFLPPLTVALMLGLFLALSPAKASTSQQDDSNLRQATLELCIEEALQNNHRRPASQYAVKMAEAQHRQALAGYWPQVSAQGGYQRMDEPLNFIFPAKKVSTPYGMNITIPEQDIKIMDEETYTLSLNTTWLLYDGGMRKGFSEQAEGQVDLMKEESRRTDLEIIDSVKRFYWGAVLATQLHQVGKDTLARMEATLGLTETMYKEGSGLVKKTDWLGNKVMVDSLRSMVAMLEKNELMAKAALANTMGLSWDQSIEPSDSEIPFIPCTTGLDKLVSSAYQFSPDWGKIEAGMRASMGALKTAKSGHYPKLAVTGKLYKWWNDYDTGADTEENEDGWSVGVGIELPLFSGGLTQSKIVEASARISKIKEERVLPKEGIGLKVRDTFLSLGAAQKSHQATLDAMEAAQENRDLNTRAYQNELVETDEVISAQLMEALMSAQHYKARYDHAALMSQLDLIVGTEVMKSLE